MEEEELVLGQEITIDHKLYRNSYHDTRNWMPKKIDECKAYVVGKRTLSNGMVIEADDNPRDFVPTLHFPAWLVVTSLHHKPFYILHPKE